VHRTGEAADRLGVVRRAVHHDERADTLEPGDDPFGLQVGQREAHDVAAHVVGEHELALARQQLPRAHAVQDLGPQDVSQPSGCIRLPPPSCRCDLTEHTVSLRMTSFDRSAIVQRQH
jgi:hypothetical protein